jgi:hypothetical protein
MAAGKSQAGVKMLTGIADMHLMPRPSAVRTLFATGILLVGICQKTFSEPPHPLPTAIQSKQSNASNNQDKPLKLESEVTIGNITQTSLNVSSNEINELVLKTIKEMPAGGGYAISSKAAINFGKSIVITAGPKLRVTPEMAMPSYCSSATYLILIQVIKNLLESGRISVDETTLRKFLWNGQPDGVGVWGRWNANGPGAARLFHELNAGENFSDLSKALPGDFLKIWWTDEIGAKERGHLVVFLETRKNEKGEELLRFWSSNIPDGYGEKEVSLAKVKQMLFSRLSRPEGFESVTNLPKKDEFLASMLKESFTFDQVKKMTGTK